MGAYLSSRSLQAHPCASEDVLRYSEHVASMTAAAAVEQRGGAERLAGSPLGVGHWPWQDCPIFDPKWDSRRWARARVR